MADDEKLRATQCVVSEIVKRTIKKKKKNTRTKFVCQCFSRLARSHSCARSLSRSLASSPLPMRGTHWCVCMRLRQSLHAAPKIARARVCVCDASRIGFIRVVNFMKYPRIQMPTSLEVHCLDLLFIVIFFLLRHSLS